MDVSPTTQYSVNFNLLFSSAFRRGHGCQTTLLRLLEDWHEALDKNQYVATVLMDLSKAFDCLPHDILLDKSGNTPVFIDKFINDDNC
jgi:hypothetical protein